MPALASAARLGRPYKPRQAQEDRRALRAAVLAVLADGEWHPSRQLHAAIKRTAPTGWLLRYGFRQPGPDDPPLPPRSIDDELDKAAGRVLHSLFVYLSYEARGPSRRREYRLTSPDGPPTLCSGTALYRHGGPEPRPCAQLGRQYIDGKWWCRHHTPPHGTDAAEAGAAKEQPR